MSNPWSECTRRSLTRILWLTSPFADEETGVGGPKVPDLVAEKMDASGLGPEPVLAEHVLYLGSSL